MRKWSCLLVAAIIFTNSAWAGLGSSLMQSAPVAGVGDFEFKIHNDIIFKRGEMGGGFNLLPHLRTGLIDPFVDVDIFFGTGTTDFQAGILGKYNLLPDVAGQVGLSFLLGGSYIRDEDLNAGLLSTGLVVSKYFPVAFGGVEPYGAFQVEWFMNPGDDTVPLTLILGSRWAPVETEPWHFYSEFAVDLNDSVWGLALGAAYPF